LVWETDRPKKTNWFTYCWWHSYIDHMIDRDDWLTDVYQRWLAIMVDFTGSVKIFLVLTAKMLFISHVTNQM
jgi:hypothetical protein